MGVAAVVHVAIDRVGIRCTAYSCSFCASTGIDQYCDASAHENLSQMAGSTTYPPAPYTRASPARRQLLAVRACVRTEQCLCLCLCLCVHVVNAENMVRSCTSAKRRQAACEPADAELLKAGRYMVVVTTWKTWREGSDLRNGRRSGCVHPC